MRQVLQQGCATALERLERDGVIGRRARLPTPRAEAKPCAGQGPPGSVMGLGLGIIGIMLVVVGFAFNRMLESFKTRQSKLIETFIAVCSCLYQATVSRQHCYGTRTGLVWYTHGQTGLRVRRHGRTRLPRNLALQSPNLRRNSLPDSKQWHGSLGRQSTNPKDSQG
jgi:hypothetical protein